MTNAGKTFTIAAITNTRKRLGLSRKGQIIVPNHLVGQWARESMQIFPGAHILAATEKDFASKNLKAERDRQRVTRAYQPTCRLCTQSF